MPKPRRWMPELEAGRSAVAEDVLPEVAFPHGAQARLPFGFARRFPCGMSLALERRELHYARQRQEHLVAVHRHHRGGDEAVEEEQPVVAEPPAAGLDARGDQDVAGVDAALAAGGEVCGGDEEAAAVGVGVVVE